MPIYELRADGIAPVNATSFVNENLQEREHLQRVLRSKVDVISPDTMVLAEEFGDWEESNRRIDLLGLDKNADLVVIELKRTEDGGHMELQAIRYAAMVSTMTFTKAVEVHQRHLSRCNHGTMDAKAAILEFLGWDEPREDEFARDVRIVLASADFSKEITTTVMWLNERQIDIRCVRLQPYKLEDKILLDVQQIVPLPEATTYQVQLKEKASERRTARQQGEGPDFTRYDLTINAIEHKAQWKRNMIYLVVKAAIECGAVPDELSIPQSKWLRVESECADRQDFEQQIRQQLGSLRVYGPSRWFNEEDELFRIGGSTYALSNQWSGASTFAAIEAIKVKFPQLGISYEEVK